MYEEYDSVRFFPFLPVEAFLGALADCLDGVLAMIENKFKLSLWKL